MPRTKYSEYSATPGDNTDIDGINIGEGMAPSDVNNSLRAFLSQTRDFIDGSSGDTLTSSNIVVTTATILSGVNVTGTATFNSAVILSSSVTGSALSLSGALTVGGATILSSSLGVTGTASMGVIDATTLEVTNLKAKDGTASATIADATGVMTVASAVLTTADINGGTLDNTVIGGATAAAGTFTTATATTGNITNVNATTVDATNVEVTNIKAKDGTAAATIADSTGVVTIPSAVLTTADINGGTVDNAAVGAGTPSTGAFTTLSSSSTTTLNGTTIPASKTLLVSTDIGSTVQGYDADTAKYDDVTANFSGTLQNGGSNVLVDTDIGSTVLAYDSNLQGFVTAFTLPTTDGTVQSGSKDRRIWKCRVCNSYGDGNGNLCRRIRRNHRAYYFWRACNGSGTITLAGTLAVANGGTGQTTFTDGEILIGKTDGSLAKATLTAGSNITITNGDGAITIASSAAAQEVVTPTNVSPADLATDIGETPTLTGSTYYSLYGKTQKSSQWQVSTDNTFATTDYDSGEVLGVGVTHAVPASNLSVSTTYYWRVRYRDTDDTYSEYSTPTEFETAASFNNFIATPTATPAIGGALEGGFHTGLIWNQVTQSATSTTIGTGSKTFTVTDSAPLFYSGQAVEVRSRANPATARMIGTVTGSSGTTLTVNVTSVDGSGTLTDWSVMAKFRVIVAPKSSGENSSKQVQER
jgi:hypothetical protein